MPVLEFAVSRETARRSPRTRSSQPCTREDRRSSHPPVHPTPPKPSSHIYAAHRQESGLAELLYTYPLNRLRQSGHSADARSLVRCAARAHATPVATQGDEVDEAGWPVPACRIRLAAVRGAESGVRRGSSTRSKTGAAVHQVRGHAEGGFWVVCWVACRRQRKVLLKWN